MQSCIIVNNVRKYPIYWTRDSLPQQYVHITSHHPTLKRFTNFQTSTLHSSLTKSISILFPSISRIFYKKRSTAAYYFLDKIKELNTCFSSYKNLLQKIYSTTVHHQLHKLPRRLLQLTFPPISKLFLKFQIFRKKKKCSSLLKNFQLLASSSSERIPAVVYAKHFQPFYSTSIFFLKKKWIQKSPACSPFFSSTCGKELVSPNRTHQLHRSFTSSTCFNVSHLYPNIPLIYICFVLNTYLRGSSRENIYLPPNRQQGLVPPTPNSYPTPNSSQITLP